MPNLIIAASIKASTIDVLPVPALPLTTSSQFLKSQDFLQDLLLALVLIPCLYLFTIFLNQRE
jgi:hypothetical protein